ncbi:MAG: TIGR02147 family protein [Fibrobacter sp.]|nr:TIGR02147 family protein [Fibrobacter sp.]
MKCVSKINVFMYFDYVEYLDAVIKEFLAVPGSSMRSLQETLGMKGSAFFSRILDRSRPLSFANAKTLAASLEMGDTEAEYFLLLVKFGNEKDVDKRDALLKQLIAIRGKNAEYALEDSRLNFFGKWYIPVIRDLLPLLPANTSAKKIGRMMVPALKESQVQNAIDYLLKNGFILKEGDGRYTVAEPIVATPPRVRSAVLRKYHKKNLEINEEVYDLLGGDDRSITSVTCSLSKESFEKIRKEIADMRERILAIAREDTNPTMVCHAGFQLVPRARKIAEGGDHE